MNRIDFEDAQSLWAANGFRGPEPRLTVKNDQTKQINDRAKEVLSVIVVLLGVWLLTMIDMVMGELLGG